MLQKGECRWRRNAGRGKCDFQHMHGMGGRTKMATRLTPFCGPISGFRSSDRSTSTRELIFQLLHLSQYTRRRLSTLRDGPTERSCAYIASFSTYEFRILLKCYAINLADSEVASRTIFDFCFLHIDKQIRV